MEAVASAAAGFISMNGYYTEISKKREREREREREVKIER